VRKGVFHADYSWVQSSRGFVPKIELPIFFFVGIRQGLRKVERVFSGIACSAEFVGFGTDGAEQSGQAQIRERIGLNVFAYILNRPARRDQFLLCRGIDAVKAR